MPGANKRRPESGDLAPLLDLICEGKSLRSACEELGLHTPSTHTWLEADQGRSEQYARAREQRAEGLAEQALTLGMGAAAGKVKPDGARVAIDAIKWATARMAPKTAPIQRVAHSFEDLTDDELNARIAAHLAGNADAPPAE